MNIEVYDKRRKVSERAHGQKKKLQINFAVSYNFLLYIQSFLEFFCSCQSLNRIKIDFFLQLLNTKSLSCTVANILPLDMERLELKGRESH